MSRLVQRPDTPWNGFLDGAIWAGFGAGVPLVGTCLVRFWDAGILKVLAVSLLMAGAASLVGGVGLALWRVIQGWAYDRFLEGP